MIIFPLGLNNGWRVVNDPLQWVLQRQQGGRWHNRSYCCTRAALLRCIREYCGDADLSVALQLPAWHPDRTRIERGTGPEALPLTEQHPNMVLRPERAEGLAR